MAPFANNSVSLRTAVPEDAVPAAALIYETALSLGDYVFGQTGPEGTIRILTILFPEKSHLFSYQYTTLAEEGNEVVGLLQALPAEELQRAGVGIFLACLKTLGLRSTIRGIRRAWPLAFEPDAKRGEFYINTLAVASAHRNRGIGAGLLREAERQARERGIGTCSLSVMLHNTAALRFYLREGYCEDLRYETKLRAPGVQYAGFHRMIKPLDGGRASRKGKPAT
ncbi:MAG: GNAT family N-acetyltransferase [Anaerolineales bacterium]|nr:GNAT family N-acetyltransferase [Anaerolineales bacterium]